MDEIIKKNSNSDLQKKSETFVIQQLTLFFVSNKAWKCATIYLQIAPLLVIPSESN